PRGAGGTPPGTGLPEQAGWGGGAVLRGRDRGGPDRRLRAGAAVPTAGAAQRLACAGRGGREDDIAAGRQGAALPGVLDTVPGPGPYRTAELDPRPQAPGDELVRDGLSVQGRSV